MITKHDALSRIVAGLYRGLRRFTKLRMKNNIQGGYVKLGRSLGTKQFADRCPGVRKSIRNEELITTATH